MTANTLAGHSDPADSTPMVRGRSADGEFLDEKRAGTKRCGTVTRSYTAGAVGKARVTVFESLDVEDRGGCVLRIEIEDGGSSWVPDMVRTAKGIELHLAGDAESVAVLEALRFALEYCAPRVLQPEAQGTTLITPG